jgi:hypothetical protein
MAEQGSAASDFIDASTRLNALLGDAKAKSFEQLVKDYFEADPADRTPNQTISTFETILVGYLEARQKVIRDAFESATAHASDVTGFIGRSSQQLAEMKEKLEGFYDSIGEPHIALDAFKTSLREELKLQEARKLWTGSAAQALRAYQMSWIALLLLLVVVPVVGLFNHGAIFQFFKDISSAVVETAGPNATDTAVLIGAVSRLVLVTLPVAMYIWLIKIIVRFNTRSLLLMDDARQRNTMLETYLHLVERDADVKADRPLILEALFRRTPGHGPETIEPVNLADVLKIGNPAKS